MFFGQESVVIIIIVTVTITITITKIKTITIIIIIIIFIRTIPPERSGDVTAEGRRVCRGNHSGNRTLVSVDITFARYDSERLPNVK